MTISKQQKKQTNVLAIFLSLSCQILAVSALASDLEGKYNPIFDPGVCEDSYPEYSSGPGSLIPGNPIYDFFNEVEESIDDAVFMMNDGGYTLQEALGSLAWGSLSYFPNVEPPKEEEFYNTIARDHYYINDVVFTNPGDGIQLPANISYPIGTPPKDGFPVIIVPPGWSHNEHKAPVAGIFRADYVIIRYTPRGFANFRNGAAWGGGSSFRTGLVDMVGCKDMSDIESIIATVSSMDFQKELSAKINALLFPESTPVELHINSDKIGMMGISYGSLLSLKALSVLGDKVKIAAALDGGIDFKTSFFEGNSINWFDLTGLYAVGSALGNAPPYMTWLYRSYLSLAFKDLSEEDWALIEDINSTHSPGMFVDLLNASNKPVYIGALWDDQMFKPGQHFDYFSRLDVDHKKMGVGNGSHSYISGSIWEEVKSFMDYHLLDQEDNGAMDYQMSMTVSNAADENGEQVIEYYANWPSDKVQNERLFLKNRSLTKFLPLVGQFGTLQTKPYLHNQVKTDHFTTLAGMNNLIEVFGPSTGIPNDIRGNIDLSSIIGGACTIPAMTGFLGNTFDVCQTATDFGEKLDEHFGMGEARIVDRNLYLSTVLPMVKDANIIWATPPATQEVKIRGRATLQVYAKSDKERAALVAYLYDLDPETGDAELITHGPFTVEQGADRYQMVKIDLQPVAWNLPAGNKLALALDGHDYQYLNRQRSNFDVTVKYDLDNNSYIDIPIEAADWENTWDTGENGFLEQLANAAKKTLEAAQKAAEEEARNAAKAARKSVEKAKEEAMNRAKALVKKLRRRL